MKLICLLMLALAGSLGWAQTAEAPKEPPRFYKLDFVVRDMEAGKVVTARNYSLILSNKGRSQVRANSSVYIGTTGYEIGANLDCANVNELNEELAFELTANISTLLGETEPHPIVRKNLWSSNVIVALKKPTVVFSSDDNTTKRVMQLEVTASQIKP